MMTQAILKSKPATPAHPAPVRAPAPLPGRALPLMSLLVILESLRQAPDLGRSLKR